MQTDLLTLRTNGGPCNPWTCTGVSASHFTVYLSVTATFLILGIISLVGQQHNYPSLALFSYDGSIALTTTSSFFFILNIGAFVLGKRCVGERIRYLQDIAQEEWKGITNAQIQELENEVLRFTEEAVVETEQRHVCQQTLQHLHDKSKVHVPQNAQVTLLDCSLALRRFQHEKVGYQFQQVTSLNNLNASIAPDQSAPLFQDPHTTCYIAQDTDGRSYEGVFVTRDDNAYFIHTLFTCNPSSNLEMKRAFTQLIRTIFSLRRFNSSENTELYVDVPCGNDILKERFNYLGFEAFGPRIKEIQRMHYYRGLKDK